MPPDPMVENIMTSCFFHGHKLMVRSKYTIFGRSRLVVRVPWALVLPWQCCRHGFLVLTAVATAALRGVHRQDLAA